MLIQQKVRHTGPRRRFPHHVPDAHGPSQQLLDFQRQCLEGVASESDLCGGRFQATSLELDGQDDPGLAVEILRAPASEEVERRLDVGFG
jgi:hypothetical protein